MQIKWVSEFVNLHVWSVGEIVHVISFHTLDQDVLTDPFC